MRELIADKKLRLRKRPTRIEKPYNTPVDYRKRLEALQEHLRERQQLLFADGRYSLLLVLQGMDTSGKDGTIAHVMAGVNPQGCAVTSFKKPSEEELAHDFLWRASKHLPKGGWIGIFNRSHYEEVLVTRVHPELLDAERLPDERLRRKDFWKERYEDIRNFEAHLHRNGTRVVKIFLHISDEEQKKRLLSRLDNPTTQWKFSESDFRERVFFGRYLDVYEEGLRNTSTDDCPWYVIPADHKKTARLLVSEIVNRTLDALPLRYPPPTKERETFLKKMRNELQAG